MKSQYLPKKTRFFLANKVIYFILIVAFLTQFTFIEANSTGIPEEDEKKLLSHLSLIDVPDDIVFRILQFLDNEDLLFRVPSVCQKFCKLTPKVFTQRSLEIPINLEQKEHQYLQTLREKGFNSDYLFPTTFIETSVFVRFIHRYTPQSLTLVKIQWLGEQLSIEPSQPIKGLNKLIISTMLLPKEGDNARNYELPPKIVSLLGSFSDLTYLDLSSLRFNQENLEILSTVLKNITKLEYLNLSGISTLGDYKSFFQPCILPKLKYLNLSFSLITPQHLKDISSFTTLEELDIANNDFIDGHLSSLSKLKNLKILKANCINMRDLLFTTDYSHLQLLELADNTLRLDEEKVIQPLLKLKTLESLSMHAPIPTAEVRKRLLENLPSLKFIKPDLDQ